MATSKKIVLFIVEGITDEISLALLLSKIIEKDKIVKFKVINGDITTENGVNPSNILSKVTSKIKNFLANNLYNKRDIISVVHLVDMDGAYIDNECIIQKNVEKLEYTTEGIYTKNTDLIDKRNQKKSQIVNKLIETNKIYTNLPYQIYFFSCNLEHVLHNNINVLSFEKGSYSDIFEDKFANNPLGFIEFMNNPEFAVDGDYDSSWDFIKKDNNSLKRHSNFHIYLNNINNN